MLLGIFGHVGHSWTCWIGHSFAHVGHEFADVLTSWKLVGMVGHIGHILDIYLEHVLDMFRHVGHFWKLQTDFGHMFDNFGHVVGPFLIFGTRWTCFIILDTFRAYVWIPHR